MAFAMEEGVLWRPTSRKRPKRHDVGKDARMSEALSDQIQGASREPFARNGRATGFYVHSDGTYFGNTM